MDYLDAIFAFFGDDEPTDELRDVLIKRIEPTESEQDDIVNANPDHKEYCNSVASALIGFISGNAEAYLATLANDNPRKAGLCEIAKVHKLIDETTQVSSVQVAEPAQTQAQTKSDTPSVDPMLGGNVTVAQTTKTTPQVGPKTTPGTDVRQGQPTQKPVITTPQSSDPITAEMRLLLGLLCWTAIRDALIKAYKFVRSDSQDKIESGNRQLAMARCTRDSNLDGTFGPKGRIFGALMRQCMIDLETKLDQSDPAEFQRRYYA